MKFGFVAKYRGAWPVLMMCEALDVSRSGFHAWLSRPRSQHSLDDDVLAEQARQSFLNSDRTYGARRVWRGARSSAAIAPNILDREFTAVAPNQKWVADFTYLWTAEGWLYVALVLDLYSRRIVGWFMQGQMPAQWITAALMMAI